MREQVVAFPPQPVITQDNVTISIKAAMRALSFIHMWIDATDGKLFIRDVVVQLSLAAFWIFGTVKVLEARRWS